MSITMLLGPPEQVKTCPSVVHKGVLLTPETTTCKGNAEFTMAFSICTYKQRKYTDGKNNPTYCLLLKGSRPTFHS